MPPYFWAFYSLTLGGVVCWEVHCGIVLTHVWMLQNSKLANVLFCQFATFFFFSAGDLFISPHNNKAFVSMCIYVCIWAIYQVSIVSTHSLAKFDFSWRYKSPLGLWQEGHKTLPNQLCEATPRNKGITYHTKYTCSTKTHHCSVFWNVLVYWLLQDFICYRVIVEVDVFFYYYDICFKLFLL